MLETMRFFYRVTLNAYCSCPRPVEVEGLCVFDKRVILFGSEGSAKIFSSELRVSQPKHWHTQAGISQMSQSQQRFSQHSTNLASRTMVPSERGGRKAGFLAKHPGGQIAPAAGMLPIPNTETFLLCYPFSKIFFHKRHLFYLEHPAPQILQYDRGKKRGNAAGPDR